MAEPITTMHVGIHLQHAGPLAPVFSAVSTTNVTAAADTQNQMVFTTLEAVQVRPPYNYGVVVG